MSESFQLRLQLPIPFADDKEFEEFIENYFNALEATNSYQLFGRKGQTQHGFDVFSREKTTVIQCKLKDVVNRKDSELVKELIANLNSDFAFFTTYNATVGSLYKKFILASTFKDDTHIQTAITKLKSDINIEYWSWAKLSRQMPEIIRLKYYPNFDKKNLEYYFGNSLTSKEQIAEDINNEEREIQIEMPIFSDGHDEFQIYSELPVIEQVEQLFSQLYDQIEFVPIQILIRKFPFQDKPFSRYSDFVLTYTNKDFKKFLSSFEIHNQNRVSILDEGYFIEQPNKVKRIEQITDKLSSNLIYYLNTTENLQSKDIRFFKSEKCNCARCQIDKFSFETIDFNIEVKDTRIKNLMNRAYAHYKLGHFKKSYLLYKQAEQEALDDKKELSLFLIRYNLIHLASVFELYYFNDIESANIAKELRSINISNSICKTKNGFNREIQNWMLNDYYMLHFQSIISEIKQQLIDHYQNSINGGIGTNNYVSDLINHYAQLQQFLQQNTIINDCYKQYLDIAGMFIEGLFASYAVEGDRNSRIESFNDWILTQIIKYGRTPSLRRLANRYKIHEIKYEKVNQDNENIQKLIIRLFEQFEIAEKKVQSVNEPNYDFFRSDYHQWMNNALFVIAHVDFDPRFINRFTNCFISYYERKTPRLATTEIVKFIERKFHLFSKTQRTKLFQLGIREVQLMRSYFMYNFAELSLEHNEKYKLQKEDLKLIIQRPLNQSSNSISIMHLYRCLSDSSQKNSIRNRILSELKEKFNLDLWNNAVLFDVIPLIDDDLTKAIEILKPKENLIGKPVSPFGGYRYNSGLDQLINVCFDRNIDLTDSRFDALRQNSPYYQWLLNIDGFDYSSFESNWLLEYGTKPYFKRFSESEVLKKHLIEIIGNPHFKNNEALSKTFIEIYFTNN